VLDHSPYFSMQCDTVEFDSIKFSTPHQQHPQIPPVSKSMWSSATESVLEYCRVVWDIFLPDASGGEQKLIRFVVSDAKQVARVLNKWDVAAEQTTHFVSAGLAGMGRPEPESRRKMADSKGYDISKGIETGLKVLCERSATQNRILQLSKNASSSPFVNRGRIVVLTHLRSNQHLAEILAAFKDDLAEINEVAASTAAAAAGGEGGGAGAGVISPIHQAELHIVHCHPANLESNIQDIDDASSVIAGGLPNVSLKVFSVCSGPRLSKKMMSLALMHYDLASTTVTGIPMKEEQNANSSANYDVELFHKNAARAHAPSHPSSLAAQHAQAAADCAAEAQTRKEGAGYTTTTLKWCTPRGAASSDLHNCTHIARVTPIDVNSRHSSCLTNFLLNGRSVMLEMPSKRSGAKILSHMLTSHGGEIFIHTLNIYRSVLDDPPNIFDAGGGRVTDYRVSDLGALLADNRLAPFYGESQSLGKHPSDPIEQSQERLTRHTLSCPLTISTTTIFNMAAVEPLQKLVMQKELSEENLAECRRVIYSLLSMENKGEQLPVPLIQQQQKNSQQRGSSSSSKQKDEYKIMFGELEQFLTKHCRTENHHKVLDCLLEVRNKTGDYPRPTPRGGGGGAKVGVADEAMWELDRREQDKFDLSNDGVLRSTTESPMSPSASVGGPSAAKRAKRSAGISLLDMWTKRVEKENNQHTPFAGQTSIGGIAKLYLTLDRKDESHPPQQQPIE